MGFFFWCFFQWGSKSVIIRNSVRGDRKSHQSSSSVRRQEYLGFLVWFFVFIAFLLSKFLSFWGWTFWISIISFVFYICFFDTDICFSVLNCCCEFEDCCKTITYLVKFHPSSALFQNCRPWICLSIDFLVKFQAHLDN